MEIVEETVQTRPDRASLLVRLSLLDSRDGDEQRVRPSGPTRHDADDHVQGDRLSGPEAVVGLDGTEELPGLRRAGGGARTEMRGEVIHVEGELLRPDGHREALEIGRQLSLE